MTNFQPQGKSIADNRLPAPTDTTMVGVPNVSGWFMQDLDVHPGEGGVRFEFSTGKTVRDEDGNEHLIFHRGIIPPLEVVYRDASGSLRLRWRTLRDRVQITTAHQDLHKEAEWTKIIGRAVRRRDVEGLLAVLDVILDRTPIVDQYPTYDEAWPPLAPDTLTPQTPDEKQARDAMGDLAGQLTPLGRLIVGMFLTSPMIKGSGSGWCEGAVVTVIGGAGLGKSKIGELCAALFGPSNGGLWSRFNTTVNGVGSKITGLSYLPFILDEARRSDSTPPIKVVQSIMGAGGSKLRSNRDGTPAPPAEPWTGVCLISSNESIADEAEEELLNRRLFEVVVDDMPVWRRDTTNLAGWWAETAGLIRAVEGWPFARLRADYPVGSKGAEAMRARVRAVQPPGPDSLGVTCQFGYVGCEWLAEWTGNTEWADGVWEAARQLIALRRRQTVDRVAEDAESIIETMALGFWTYFPDRPTADLYGWRTTAAANSECNVRHEGECRTYAGRREKLSDLLGFGKRGWKRVVNSDLRHAMVPNRDGTYERRSSPSAGVENMRVAILCAAALQRLAEVGLPDEETNVPIPNPINQPEPGKAWRHRPAREIEADAPEFEEPEQASEVDEAPATFRWESIDTDDMAEGLTKIIKHDLTHVVVPVSWSPEGAADAGWDTHGWNGTGPGVVTRDGHKVRLMPDPDPAGLSNGLRVFNDAVEPSDRVRFTIPATGTDLLRKIAHQSRRGNPRWVAPKSIIEVFDGSGPVSSPVAAPMMWTAPDADPDASVVSYDRNAAHLASIPQVMVAPLWRGEEFTRSDDPASIPDPEDKAAGMWLIEVPNLIDPRLPDPLGSAFAPDANGKRRTGRVWVSAELLRFYHEQDVYPEVVAAVTAPASRPAFLRQWAEQVKGWREDFTGTPALPVVKSIYASLAGRLMMRPTGKASRAMIQRPDWGRAIADHSWVGTLRYAYRVAREQGVYPVGVNVDAIKYPSGSVVDLPVADQVGRFKIEKEG